ncbi:MAG: hypothetical protein QNJ98_01750 [Planctomycetota bacterium]|nr:hypothetical protein [Planctomycetota bacterium]
MQVPARARCLSAYGVTSLAVGALVLTLLVAGSKEGVAKDEASTDPVLEVVIDTAPSAHHRPTLRQRMLASCEAAQKRPGFRRADAALVPGSPVRLLRATEWASVADLEAASLAGDGSAAEKGLLAAVLPQYRKVRYFRQLREHRYSDGNPGLFEVTIYRTKPGTTREANLARFDAAEADFAKGEGILGHSMWIAPSGHWAHVVHWRSEADFKKTGKALMRSKGVGGWIRSLDFQRFTVWKGPALGTVR